MVRAGVFAILISSVVVASDVPPGATQTTNPLLDRVSAGVAAAAPDLISLRHDLHRHPELSGAEERTSRLVAARLSALGLEVRTGVGGYGVVAVLRGGRPGPLVAYRADMDAFPSTDPDPVEFRSQIPGVRHICGHDVHTAVGVALAVGLAGVRADLPGAVMFIFQPAEESATGAKAMLADGVFAREKPVAIYGVHTAPYEVGQIGTRPGAMMAARDGVRVTIYSKRDLSPAEPALRAALMGVATITPAQTLQPGPEGFVLVQLGPSRTTPGSISIAGIVTLASEATRQRVREAIGRGLTSIPLGDYEQTYVYVPKQIAGVTNDVPLTAAAVASLTAALGPAAVQTVQSILPAFSEDFGSFQDEVPGVFFFLGVSNAAKGTVGMPHSPAYVADDGAIAFGARAMAAVLLGRMQRRN